MSKYYFFVRHHRLLQQHQQTISKSYSAAGDDCGKKEEEGDGKTGDVPPPLFREILEAYGGGYSAGEGGQAAAYVCFDNTCSAPVHTVAGLEKLL